MYVGETGHVFIEKQHPIYPHVIDFLISCCEPVSRTEHMEQYRLDSSSLSAASAEGTYSIDMIRNILTYFRQDARTGQSFLDLEMLSALEAWAASREAEMDPTSHDRCLRQQQQQQFPTPTRAREGCHVGTHTAAATFIATDRGTAKDERTAGTAAGDEQTVEHQQPRKPGSPASRVLVLRSTRQSPAAVASTDKGSCQNSSLRDRPLVALAVRGGLSWDPPPLPPAIEETLREESRSAKVQIILQPRLRRFTQEAIHAPSYSTQQRAQQLRKTTRGDVGDAHEELYYFVVSSDREQLERVMDSEAKAFLEPVVLHGSSRWILSDVDRGVEALQVNMESGRPATLRRLYGTGVCAVEEDAATAGRERRAIRQKSKKVSGAEVSRLVYKMQVKPGQLRSLKDSLYRQFGIRADCFYDHLQDPTLHVDNLSLASKVRLRPYQTASLERFQRGNKAHQGVVVLPCGAGKTLTGIGAAALMKKRTIVLCINNMSVFQWQREFLRWTNLSEGEVTVCTAKEKAMPGKVFITTYSMLVAQRGQAAKGAAAQESEEILEAVRSQTWGLLLLDEVHTAVARNFQKVLDQIKYKCVLGLSATLLREDDRIDNLRHLVGPKLYEANWLDLTRAGFLAKAECAEVQCPMPASFSARYAAGRAGAETEQRRHQLQNQRGDDSGDSDDSASDDDGDGGGRKRRRRRQKGAPGGINSLARVTASCNPNKLWCTQALLEFHRNRSPPDKVLIFCDYLADVRFYAYHLHLPFMDQRTSESERTNLLRYFQFSDSVNALILTRVGDVALDLPCASVIIQISGLGGSQRQEAQRLGRILRPKPPSLDNTCSYFYTLVSQGTHEVENGYRRQRWLRDQGFACRVLRCEHVLVEYARMGGSPCCVGPPQWWYGVPAPGPRQRHDTSQEHDGSWWAPFSREASARLQHAFNNGKAGCVLEGRAHLGSATPRPLPAELGGVAVGQDESWTVQFNSADAPRTFGTVVIGEAAVTSSDGGGEGGPRPPNGTGAAAVEHTRVRRITFGQFKRPHRCLDEEGPCLPFALASLGATVDGGEDNRAAREE